MLKVMTLNVNGYGETHGAWRSRRDLIAEAIEEADPSVVALQAVRREPQIDGGVDQASQIARLLSGYPYVIFEPGSMKPDGAAEGLAFISRSPALEMGSIHLNLARGAEDASRRMVLQALFSVGGGIFRLFNAHFSWVPELNEGNLREARGYLRSFEGPSLLLGDFNATADSRAVSALEADGWGDVWPRLRGTEEGLTFPSREPEKRIDFVWASSAMNGAVRSIEVRGPGPGSGRIHLSDHLGLVVGVEVAAEASPEVEEMVGAGAPAE